MALADVLPDEELRALLLSCDERLDKVEFLKRAQLISLCQAQARALAHFRSAPQDLPRPEIVLEPIILELVVSGDSAVGGAASGVSLTPALSLCDVGVGDALALLSARSVSTQVTTTRPATGPSSSRRLPRQAPPVRVGRHRFHSVRSASIAQDVHTVFEDDGSEDESEYPLGYYDESDDDYEVEYGGPLAFPHFSSSQLEQDAELDTGFQAESYGGLLQASEAEFFPPALDDGNYDIAYESHSDDHEEHDSGGAHEDEDEHSDYISGSHYDSESGGASSDSPRLLCCFQHIRHMDTAVALRQTLHMASRRWLPALEAEPVEPPNVQRISRKGMEQYEPSHTQRGTTIV
ncbi:hypothetical protein CYMTET_37575 [Cymbomonas tetramitiformis]|uniref:Uncharacterized protein n=1 Tax=Cymbomonas tetramitiformis TaxID=36881 RepID=A0AAE0F6I1_9CHLO|nr:hypothetical protein CYMTET_37575 [Cymbomonas tetramitiformis]